MNALQPASPQQAVTHLFFHCCFRDGVMSKDELNVVADKLVAIGLNLNMNFTDEVKLYQNYRTHITDERAFIRTLLTNIAPVNNLALYSYCVELCVSDGVLKAEEDMLLHIIAGELQLEIAEQETAKTLMIQRKAVETQHKF